MKALIAGLIALAIAMSFGMALPAVSSAQGTPCANGNPTDLCGDTIEVRVATTAECPNGGIVVIIHHVTTTATTDESFTICNGADGAPGPQGPPGPPGDTIDVSVESAGANCPTGGIKIVVTHADQSTTTRFVCNGTAGANGTSPTVTPATSAQCPAGGVVITPVGGTPTALCNGTRGRGLPSCVSKRVGRWFLVVRKGHRVTRLRAWTDGNRSRAKVRRSRVRGRVLYTVRANFRGIRRPGTYVVRVRYRIDGRRNTKIHYFRICMGGNPLRGLHDSLNRFPVTVL